MRATLLVHVVAGGLGLLTGFVALYAAKGAGLHRRSGLLFTVTMLAMCASGLAMTLGRGIALAVNVPAATITAYLVLTGLATVRAPAAGLRCLERAGMLVALAVGVTCLAFGAQALASATGRAYGMPAFPFLLFGVLGLLGAVGDARMLRAGRPAGARRLARHLWRMSTALLIAAMSFFLGQADELPAALRIPALLATPVLAVLVTMTYWLWRVRWPRSVRGLRGVARVGAPSAAG